ncbi:MAG: hypothetical protein NZU74_20385, partial [Chloroflexaceae bacterium]|nr:hypothetical protein [Chloroflexaceae bacterium]
NMRKHKPRNADELRVLAKVLIWLHENGDGERRPLSLGPIDFGAWARLSAEDELCTNETCRERMQGRCPLYRARRAAEAAHVIVVNHALLLADIATENRVLPPYNYLVLDEAHHLEAATTDGLSFEWKLADFERKVKDVGSPNSGLLGELLSAARERLRPDAYAGLEVEAGRVYERATNALAQARAFFDSVAAFLEERREGRPIGEYGQSLRLLPATRRLPSWSTVTQHWEQLKPTLTELAESLGRIG